jgi:ornithine lipid ester-linked acyl 2-hydroxylase
MSRKAAPPRHPLFFDLLHLFESKIEQVSLIPPTAFVSKTHFPWATRLEAAIDDIEEEYQGLLDQQEPLPAFQDISPEQGNITQDQNWKTFLLYAYGAKSVRNTRLCPKTTNVLESIPGLKTAFFSILAPGKVIPPHRGPYKGLLRAHLGVRVPDGNCAIRVGSDTENWQRGQTLFFDDTLNHEAWNLSSQERVVLFLDVLRPLRPPYDLWNERVIRWIATGPFGRRSLRVFQNWYAKKGLVNDATFDW